MKLVLQIAAGIVIAQVSLSIMQYTVLTLLR